MDIPRGTELLVWYNDSYTSFFGIPLQCIAQDENRKQKPRLIVVSFARRGGKKKGSILKCWEEEKN